MFAVICGVYICAQGLAVGVCPGGWRFWGAAANMLSSGVVEGSRRMGLLWDLIQRHIDAAPYPPSERQVAAKLGVSPTTLANWRELKRLPSRESLRSIADLVGVRYAVVLDAALRDTGYHEEMQASGPDLTLEQVEEQRQELLAALAELDSRDDAQRAG